MARLTDSCAFSRAAILFPANRRRACTQADFSFTEACRPAFWPNARGQHLGGLISIAAKSVVVF